MARWIELGIVIVFWLRAKYSLLSNWASVNKLQGSARFPEDKWKVWVFHIIWISVCRRPVRLIRLVKPRMALILPRMTFCTLERRLGVVYFLNVMNSVIIERIKSAVF